MSDALVAAFPASPAAEADRLVAGTFAREARLLRGFIRRRVADVGDADDILQDVFSELIEATRLATPIEHVGAWLFRVATNRITDRFRRQSPIVGPAPHRDDGDDAAIADRDDSLAAAADEPDARYAGNRLLDDLEAALDELPAAQREVFVAHELEGRSFASLADESGASVNTLLARKRYAVLHLRRRLQAHHDDL